MARQLSDGSRQQRSTIRLVVLVLVFFALWWAFQDRPEQFPHAPSQGILGIQDGVVYAEESDASGVSRRVYIHNPHGKGMVLNPRANLPYFYRVYAYSLAKNQKRLIFSGTPAPNHDLSFKLVGSNIYVMETSRTEFIGTTTQSKDIPVIEVQQNQLDASKPPPVPPVHWNYTGSLRCFSCSGGPLREIAPSLELASDAMNRNWGILGDSLYWLRGEPTVGTVHKVPPHGLPTVQFQWVYHDILMSMPLHGGPARQVATGVMGPEGVQCAPNSLSWWTFQHDIPCLMHLQNGAVTTAMTFPHPSEGLGFANVGITGIAFPTFTEFEGAFYCFLRSGTRLVRMEQGNVNPREVIHFNPQNDSYPRNLSVYQGNLYFLLSESSYKAHTQKDTLCRFQPDTPSHYVRLHPSKVRKSSLYFDGKYYFDGGYYYYLEPIDNRSWADKLEGRENSEPAKLSQMTLCRYLLPH